MGLAKDESLEMESEEWKGDEHNHDHNHDRTQDMESEADAASLLKKDYEEETEYESEDDLEKSKNAMDRRPRYKGWIWMALSCFATLNGRRILTGGFPFPIYFVFVTQLGAYVSVAVLVLVVKSTSCLQKKREETVGRNSVLEWFVIITRTVVASCLEGLAVICAAEAVLHFSSLPLFAMLPISIYALDSLLFRFARLIRIIPRDQDTSKRNLYVVAIVLLCAASAIYEDYRLNLKGLLFALVGFLFASLGKLFSTIGPRIEKKGTLSWKTPLYTYLWAAVPALVLTGFATVKLENHSGASELAKSWTFMWRFWNLCPAVLLHILFRSPINSAYPFISREHVGGALEENTAQAKDAVASTLQSGFWILVLGVIRKESTLIDWFQAAAFIIIYVVSVGPRHIGYYPPRLLNLICRLCRRRPMPIHYEPWQFPIFLTVTTAIFSALITCNVMFWVNTLAFNHSLTHWNTPSQINADTLYRPQMIRLTEVIIAHSADDPLSSITDIISTFVQHAKIDPLGTTPKITIYTQSDLTITSSTAYGFKSATNYQYIINVKSVPNIGGPTAVYLKHILEEWDRLTVQTIFFDTSSTTSRSLMLSRWENYFYPPGHPLPDALPKTGFLSLGEEESCECDTCWGADGWEDSFHLIPSMYGASHTTGSKTCSGKRVLLTKGNNFIASAARIRGVKKDVYEMLYGALVNQDVANAWAHDKKKLPVMSKGEEGKGRWKKGEIYGEQDRLERPWLGFTIERLWGTLLQCGGAKHDWTCPGALRGWRRWGTEHDCGCID